MKIILCLFGLGASLAVAGCAGKANPLDPQKPLDQMSQAELCAYYPVYIGRTDISEESRRIATGKMRASCPGTR